MKLEITFSKIIFLIAAAVFLFCSPTLFSIEYEVIRNPEPTVEEVEPVMMEEILTVDEDLGNDQYLFYPYSIAADKSNIFIYDKSQARVYRFSPAMELLGYFGRKGPGPGEFNSTAKRDYVSIEIGVDGNIYTNDLSIRRIKQFDSKGKHLKSFFYGDNYYFEKPAGDKNGNILYVSMRKGILEVKNDKRETLAHTKIERVHRSFLYEKPSDQYLESNDIRTFVSDSSWKLTIDSKLLVLFRSSSTLAIFDGDKYVKTIKLWPREALKEYKKKLRQFMKKKKNVFSPMFSNIIIDQDHKDIFYLQLSSHKRRQKIAATLYAFNLAGELLKVIYIPTNPNEENPGYARVEAKVNNIFYTIRDKEEVVLFREEKR
jgi:hypothetical protein